MTGLSVLHLSGNPSNVLLMAPDTNHIRNSIFKVNILTYIFLFSIHIFCIQMIYFVEEITFSQDIQDNMHISNEGIPKYDLLPTYLIKNKSNFQRSSYYDLSEMS